MSVIRPPRRLDLQPRRCSTMREYVLPVPPHDPREQAVQVRVDPVPPEGLLMTMDAQTDKWTLLARIDYLQRCHLAAIEAGERTIATLASEKAELLAALKLMVECMEAHDHWCGHNPMAPGDSIHNRAVQAAEVAIAKAEGRAEWCSACHTLPYCADHSEKK